MLKKKGGKRKKNPSLCCLRDENSSPFVPWFVIHGALYSTIHMYSFIYLFIYFIYESNFQTFIPVIDSFRTASPSPFGLRGNKRFARNVCVKTGGTLYVFFCFFCTLLLRCYESEGSSNSLSWIYYFKNVVIVIQYLMHERLTSMYFNVFL